MSIKIRKLRRRDLTQNSGLYEALNSLSPSQPLDDDGQKFFWEIYDKSANPIFVATNDGYIIGTCTVCIKHRIARNCDAVADIEDVATNPKWQGKGVQTKLLNSVLSFIHDAGIRKVRLVCRDDLEGFYEKFGFQKEGVSMSQIVK